MEEGGDRVCDLRFLDEIVAGNGIFHPQLGRAAREDAEEGNRQEFHVGDSPGGSSVLLPRFLRETRVHLVLLNWDLMNGPILLKFLRASTSITCADGGGSRLLDRLWQYDLPTIADVFHVQRSGQQKQLFLVGDMDSYSGKKSIDPRLGIQGPPERSLERFGFKCTQIRDQKSTDFEKVIDHLIINQVLQPGDTLVVDGAYGGRFDQTIANFAALYKRVSRATCANKAADLKEIRKANVVHNHDDAPTTGETMAELEAATAADTPADPAPDAADTDTAAVDDEDTNSDDVSVNEGGMESIASLPMQMLPESVNICLLGNLSLASLLAPGTTRIIMPKRCVSDVCALLPMGKTA